MAALETRDDRTEAGTPIPPGSTEQEIIDIKNHELPPLPKMTPQLADQPPQEQDQTTWGYSGTPKEPRAPEPVLPWEEPHPLKPPIPLKPPAGHSLAVEEEPLPPPDAPIPNPADAPENFAEMPPPEPVPNQMARAAVERAISGEEPVPVSGPYSAPGPYPQGPTNKGLHGRLAAEDEDEELQVDDQTANPAPTTEWLLQRPPEGTDGAWRTAAMATTDRIDRNRARADRIEGRADHIEGRAGEIGTGAFRGPYYNFVGRVGPYPQGPTTKGIHTPPDGEFPPSLLATDDQTSSPLPTTERLLRVRPRTADDLVEGDYEPLNPELEPEPGAPGVPIVAEQPAFAYGDPGTGLENIHTEPPEGEGGPEPEIPELVIAAPTDGATVPAVHDVTGSGALPDSTVELWHLISATQVADTQVATTTADSSGNWAFAGDTPTVPGECIWQVRQDGYSSAQVTVTVEETPPLREGDEWQRLPRHADLDDYLKSRNDLREPEEWMGLTVADKKAWLDRNAR